MPASYVDKCVLFADKLRALHPYNLEVGGEVGRGGDYVFRSLGNLGLEEFENQFEGIKIPHDTQENVKMRFFGELAFITFILNESPEFDNHFPSFMCLIETDGEEKARAIVTEDVTKDRLLPSYPMSATNKSREALYAPFREFGEIDEVVIDDVCNSNLAFDVEGEEKLLDLSPYPVKSVFQSTALKKLRSAVNEMAAELTVNIPARSKLANALRRG